MTLLSVRNLSLSIGRHPILSDVSFDIGEGQIFGLVGESGSGKSMTALALMGLAPASARVRGTAQFGGIDLLAQTERQMTRLRGRDIGMIFQEPMTALNPMKTIGDQVAETLLVHRAVSRAATRTDAQAVAAEKLARVGLPTDRFPLSLYPHELSGGQRQRVAIAMAIALRPRLLIADEPTTALDVTTQAQILDLLRGLAADEGLALLLITHDLAVVADMARQLAVMQGGRIVETGATEPLFRAPRQDYTRRLLRAAEHRPARRPPARSTNSSAPLLSVEGAVRDYILPRPSAFAPHPLLLLFLQGLFSFSYT